MPFLHLPFSLYTAGFSFPFAQVSGICQPQNKVTSWKGFYEWNLSPNKVQRLYPNDSFPATGWQAETEQTESCFFLFPRQWWVALAGIFSPGGVTRDLLPTGSLFRHCSFLAPLQALCLSTNASGGLSCSEPSYLLSRAWSYKRLSCAISFYWLSWGDHTIPQIWALRHFKGRLPWLGTTLGLNKWILILWDQTPGTLCCSSFPSHQTCPDFHHASGLPLPL